MPDPFWHDNSITIKHPAYYLPHIDGKISPDTTIAGGKLKLYCTQCFEAHIVKIQETEAKDYAAGRRENPGCMRTDIEAECE